MTELSALKRAVGEKARAAKEKREEAHKVALEKSNEKARKKAEQEALKAAKRIEGTLWRKYVEGAIRVYMQVRGRNMGKLEGKSNWNRRALGYLKEILEYAERDADKAIEVIRLGIIYARDKEQWVKKANHVDFNGLASNQKIIRWYETYQTLHVRTRQKMSHSFDGSKSLDPRDALYQPSGKEPVICRIIGRSGGNCKVAFSKDSVDVVSEGDLKPVYDLKWYQYADPFVFQNSEGYKKAYPEKG